VVLSWHVDYWDRLGWKDPFGAKEFTARQRALSKARALKQIWTPMLCVDSKPVRGKQFGKAVEQARKRKPDYQAALSAKAGVEAKIVIKGKLPEKAELVAVLFQEQVTTKCTAGENKGKTLHEFFVARTMSKPLDLKAAFDKGVTVKFEMPKGSKPENLGVVFLLEDRATMTTLQSWWTPLAR
jgi:hypothetical protein